jgi:hypothetical protein
VQNAVVDSLKVPTRYLPGEKEENIAVYCENNAKHTNALCGQNTDLHTLKQVAHTATTEYRGPRRSIADDSFFDRLRRRFGEVIITEGHAAGTVKGTRGEEVYVRIGVCRSDIKKE